MIIRLFFSFTAIFSLCRIAFISVLLTCGVLNPTKASLRLLPSFVLSILQSVIIIEAQLPLVEAVRCAFKLDSLQDGERFFIHTLDTLLLFLLLVLELLLSSSICDLAAIVSATELQGEYEYYSNGGLNDIIKMVFLSKPTQYIQQTAQSNRTWNNAAL